MAYVKQERNFGVHLIQSSYFTDKENESPKEEGTYGTQAVCRRWQMLNNHLLNE